MTAPEKYHSPFVRTRTPSPLTLGANTLSLSPPAAAPPPSVTVTFAAGALPADPPPPAPTGWMPCIMAPSSHSFFRMAIAVGTTFVARNINPGTTPMRIAVSTSMLLYMALMNKPSATRNKSVMGLRSNHIASSKPVMSNAAIIQAGAAGAPPRAAASLAASAWDTAYAVSASNLRHALRHSCGVSMTASSSSPAHSLGKGAICCAVRCAPSPPPPSPLPSSSSSSSGSRMKVARASSMASCRFRACSSLSLVLTPAPLDGVAWSSPAVPSRDTASSPRTRTASRCARRLAAATSSDAFHVRGSPLESLEKTRANAVFMSSTTFSAASRVLPSTVSRTRVAMADEDAAFSSGPGSNPANAS
mmetsp:Transcript_6930/g.31276  ORF Transcript_6930/g.31276 Transcript_6930/m.31276 type:complete len:361 (+) Transcript_6930:58-1140(+)